MWISRREHDLLLREIDYWRGLFERERERADRIVDEGMLSMGRAPVSEFARAERAVDREKVEKLRKQTEELLVDEVGAETAEVVEAARDAAVDLASRRGLTLN